MDWQTIIAIILGSSVLSVLLNSIISLISQKYKRNRYNSFIALTLAHGYEKYVYLCWSLLSDDELYKSSKGIAGKFIRNPPQPYAIPKEDFRDFDIKLLDKILEFPQKALYAKSEVNFLWDIADDDKALETSRNYTIELASQALAVADILRKKYKLPNRLLKFGAFDLREELEKKSKD